MLEVLQTLVLPLVVILLTAIVGRVLNRNEVAQTKQEVELLKQLDPKSLAAKNLNEVIEDRVARWHAKRFKKTVEVKSASKRRLIDVGTFTDFFGVGAASVVVVVAIIQWFN